MKTIEKAKLSSNVSAQTEQTSLYDIELNDLQGNPMSLSKFKGKKCNCGYKMP